MIFLPLNKPLSGIGSSEETREKLFILLITYALFALGLVYITDSTVLHFMQGHSLVQIKQRLILR